MGRIVGDHLAAHAAGRDDREGAVFRTVDRHDRRDVGVAGLGGGPPERDRLGTDRDWPTVASRWIPVKSRPERVRSAAPTT